MFHATFNILPASILTVQVNPHASAIEAGSDCGAVLQQLAALRGAVNGLVYEVLEGHLRETFGQNEDGVQVPRQVSDTDMDQSIALIRSYLK